MSPPTRFHFSSHAKRRAEERGISLTNFIEVVTNHESRRQQHRGQHGGFVYLFEKDVAERRLYIAAEVYKDDCYFVTGYWQ
jgi:hypothetical protein